jgi:hypothetical protein
VQTNRISNCKMDLIWGLQRRSVNPPPMDTRLIRFMYVLMYALDTAYIAPQRIGVTHRAYRRRTYATFQMLLQDTPDGRPLRVETKWTHIDWNQVWHNLHITPEEEPIKDTWYKILHDIPAKERLHTIHLSGSDMCDACNVPDTIHHHLVECGERARTWACTKYRLGLILRTYPRQIPDDWLYRPKFRRWPPQRHRAVMWILANVVEYQGRRGTQPSRCDLYDFFQRSRGSFTKENVSDWWVTTSVY